MQTLTNCYKTVEVGAMARVECLSEVAKALIKKALTFTSTGKKPYTLELYKELKGNGLYIPRTFADGSPISGRWPGIAVKANMTLRPAQIKLVQDYLNALRTNSPYGGIIKSSPGSGKTLLGVYLICHFKYPALIIVPTDRLMDQWKDRLKTFSNLLDDDIGIIRQSKCDVENKKVVIGMIHSLSKADTKYPYIADKFGFIIFDETHVLGAKSFSKTAGFFNCRYRLALSATPRRHDGMEPVFLYHIGGIVADSGQIKIHPRIIYQNYAGQDTSHNGYIWRGELNLGRYLNKIASSLSRNVMIANAIIMAYRKDRDILILSDRLNQLEILKQLIIAGGISEGDIGFFTGNSKQLDRKVLLATYGSASMGADIPRLSTLVMATPRVDLEQSIGRILRDTEGRQHEPVVIDIVDTASSIMRNWAKARLRLYKRYTTDIIGLQ